MADRITAEERRLIDAHLSRHGARHIPRGVCAETEAPSFRELETRAHRLNLARRRAAGRKRRPR